MRKKAILVVSAGLCVAAFTGTAHGTPSTTYWTPCVIDIQPVGKTHITVDNYFTTPGRTATDDPVPDFPTDFGLTWGANLSPKLAAEFGFDVMSPAEDPWFFNAKVGYREGALSKNAPAVQLGFFNFGTKSDVTNQNIIHLMIGKSLRNGKTRLAGSYYVGNGDVLRSSAGEKENSGFMVAFDHVLVPGKVILAGDYASGDNAIGGGGIGVYYYFTPDIDLLVGPVWFNDKGINGEMKWTTQLDINF